jgi:L-rhamnose isomerase
MNSIELLLSKQEIIELTYKYSWAIDSNNINLLDEVFTENATGNFIGNFCNNRDEIKNFIEKNLKYHITQHLVSNHLIEINKDTARNKCQLSAQHVLDPKKNSPNYLLIAHYNDLLIRTPNGWRIDHRELVATWSQGELDTPGVKTIKIPDVFKNKK